MHRKLHHTRCKRRGCRTSTSSSLSRAVLPCTSAICELDKRGDEEEEKEPQQEQEPAASSDKTAIEARVSRTVQEERAIIFVASMLLLHHSIIMHCRCTACMISLMSPVELTLISRLLMQQESIQV
jgi:hypothetical protein